MALLIPQPVAVPGTLPIGFPASALGDTIRPAGGAQLVLAITNTSGAARTVTLVRPGAMYGQPNPDVSRTVANGETHYLRIPPEFADPEAGVVDVLYDNPVGLTVAVLRVGPVDPGGGVSYTVPYPTGGDDTGMILAAIEATPDGSIVEFPTGALYLVQGTLELDGRAGLTIDANRSTIQATATGDRTRSHWRFRACTSLVINDPHVIGANPNAGLADAAYVADLEAQMAFEIDGGTDITINRPVASDIYGDFVYVTSDSGVWADGVTVNDPTFDRNGRQGFTVIAGRNVLCQGGRWSQIRRSWIDIEANISSQGCDGFTMRDTTVDGIRSNMLSCEGADAHVDHVLLDNVAITNGYLKAFVAAPTVRRTDFTIRNCRSDAPFGQPAGYAMHFTRCDGVVVVGNTQPMQAGRNMALVGVTDCTGVDVEGNDVANGIQSRTV